MCVAERARAVGKMNEGVSILECCMHGTISRSICI